MMGPARGWNGEAYNAATVALMHGQAPGGVSPAATLAIRGGLGQADSVTLSRLRNRLSSPKTRSSEDHLGNGARDSATRGVTSPRVSFLDDCLTAGDARATHTQRPSTLC